VAASQNKTVAFDCVFLNFQDADLETRDVRCFVVGLDLVNEEQLFFFCFSFIYIFFSSIVDIERHFKKKTQLLVDPE